MPPQMQALETGPSGAPVAWRNPDSGRYGNVVPGPAYQASGATCRQYTHTVYIDGTPQSAARHRLPQSRRHLDHAQLTAAGRLYRLEFLVFCVTPS